MNNVSLYAPDITEHSVSFRWLVEPATPLYRTNTFTMHFPQSVQVRALPEAFWWRIALLCLHPHWVVLRPVRVHLPVRLPEEEREFWSRLMDSVSFTLDAYRFDKAPGGSVQIVDAGREIEPMTLACQGDKTATSFSGGKDSLLHAGLLRELTGDPVLVTTTSPMPPLLDHLSSRRRYVMSSMQQAGFELVEVKSDLRSIWKNDFAVDLGYQVAINELTDTHLYLASLLVVAFSRGISNIFLASEAEVQENVEIDGRIVQHPHAMYSVATLRSLEKIFSPLGIHLSSLTSPLQSTQVQSLLWRRYPDIAHLQYSCWRVNASEATCSACSQCLRVAMQCVAEGHDPRRMGIDLEKLLIALGHWTFAVASSDLPLPKETVRLHLNEQVIRSIQSISTERMVRAIRGRGFFRAAKPSFRKAISAFHRLQRSVANIQIRDVTGYREGYARYIVDSIRDSVKAVYEKEFGQAAFSEYGDNLERTERLANWISEPLAEQNVVRKMEWHRPPVLDKARCNEQELAEIEHLIPGPEPEWIMPADAPEDFRPIPVSTTSLTGNESLYVNQCLDENWISSGGRFVGMFEESFAEAMGCRYAVACSSGTTALHLVLAALGLKSGDEVIIPTFTMIATANTVTYTGASPVLVDAEPRTWNMNVDEVERGITARTKAIVAVHTYGHPADMDALRDIARRNRLALIEDAAEAHGAHHKGKPAGSLGHAAAFSFYGNKIISTGEGGMVTTNDERIARVARKLRDHAFSDERHFWHEYVGFNYRMTNLQAAVGLAQTERLEELVGIRRRNAHLYSDRLRNVPGLTLPGELADVRSVFWMYSILLDDDFGCSRDVLRVRLGQRGIETRTLFVPIHLQPVYRAHYKGMRFPVSEDLCRRGLYLPSGPTLTEGEIDYICTEVAQAAGDSISRTVGSSVL